MTFEFWLKQFNKQQTPIGDLARDFKQSGCYTIRESFDKYTPCAVAEDTYRRARKAYILELANLLHDELSHILANDEQEPTLWHSSLNILHDLSDILADIDSYLDNGLEDEI